MRRRWMLLGGAALVAAAAVPGVAIAATGSFGSSVDQQSAAWRVGTISTRSTTFQLVPGLGKRICARGEVSATVSLEGEGAPMGVLVRMDDGPTLRPDAIRFTPAGGIDTTSFTFFINAQPFEANDNHFFQVEWRSPFAKTTSLLEASMNLVYAKGTLSC